MPFEVAAFSRLRKNFDSSEFRGGRDFSRAVKSLKMSPHLEPEVCFFRALKRAFRSLLVP